MAPPPGSPTRPSATALPNDLGNSNGIVPSGPVDAPQPSGPSFFRRAMGAVLPSHYTRLPTTSEGSGPRVGHGNDGVFANIMGKPQVAQTVVTESGETIMVPETTQKEVPPVSSLWPIFARS